MKKFINTYRLNFDNIYVKKDYLINTDDIQFISDNIIQDHEHKEAFIEVACKHGTVGGLFYFIVFLSIFFIGIPWLLVYILASKNLNTSYVVKLSDIYELRYSKEELKEILGGKE
jgi:hypothetical protein